MSDFAKTNSPMIRLKIAENVFKDKLTAGELLCSDLKFQNSLTTDHCSFQDQNQNSLISPCSVATHLLSPFQSAF